jgi:hypothetical protein
LLVLEAGTVEEIDAQYDLDTLVETLAQRLASPSRGQGPAQSVRNADRCRTSIE